MVCDRSSTTTPASASARDEVGRPIGLPVVVAEHGDDGNRRARGRRPRRRTTSSTWPCCVRSPASRTRSACSRRGRTPRGRGRARPLRRGCRRRPQRCIGLRHRSPAYPGIGACHSRVPTRRCRATEPFSELLDAMKHAAATLRDHGIDVRARGRPRDLRARRRRERARRRLHRLPSATPTRALDLLGDAGFRCERPPEGWLYKVYDDGDAMIDLIFAPNSRPETVDAMLERADELEVYAIRMQGDERHGRARDEAARAEGARGRLRRACSRSRARCASRSTGPLLREHTGDSPYAKAFFTLADELGVSRRG